MKSAHDRALADAQARVEFESFVADAAARFTAALPPRDVDREIEDVLGGAHCQALSWMSFAASAHGIEPVPAMNFAAAFPWQFQRLHGGGQPVTLSSLADLPVEAAQDRRSAMAMGIRSMLLVPVAAASGGRTA